jgi:16S rRNA (guanine(1405)-N(7))-methyltransferase
LIARVGRQELAKRKNLKTAVKTTKNKLHQVGGAYFGRGEIDYGRFLAQLETLPVDADAARPLCRDMMSRHTSTAERLPHLQEFYDAVFAALPPVHTVIDIACGLNPLAWPWMGLPGACRYTAVDIYSDMLAAHTAFFQHLGINGQIRHLDILSESIPEKHDLALILKTLPCLEQVDKEASQKLLDNLNARFLLISYPRQSLGGRGKGMAANYEAHFQQLAANNGWQSITPVTIPTEIAYLVAL